MKSILEEWMKSLSSTKEKEALRLDFIKQSVSGTRHVSVFRNLNVVKISSDFSDFIA